MNRNGIGNRLRMKRLIHRLSQDTVSEQALISQQFLSAIERNEKEFDRDLIHQVDDTIDCLTGKASKDKVLERIARIVSATPFPRDNGEIFYWQGHVQDGRLVFVSGRNKVELWEETCPQDEAAVQNGMSLFRLKLRVRFEDGNGMTRSFLWKGFPGPKELRESFKDTGIAAGLLDHLAEFISKWYSTTGVQKSRVKGRKHDLKRR